MKTITRAFCSGDRKIFYFLNSNIKCGLLDKIMRCITELGGTIFTVGLTLSLLIFGKNLVRMLGFRMLVSLSITTLFVQILKRSVSRERPYNILKDIHTFNIELKDYSFPSGHTAASFSIATMIYFYAPYLMLTVMLIASLVGISRIYLAVHYPSDVLVGIILGISSSILTNSYIFEHLF